uniref:Secreted protein n=1 Tax=Anopheles culicifacies TaxID=139723 RepID=A0A182M442_9DIPT
MSVYFLILLATLISTYLSPIETTIPPISAGSTLAVSWMVWFGFRNACKDKGMKISDLPTSPYEQNRTLRAFSSCLRWPSSSGLAVFTSHTTSPRSAAMIKLNALIIPSRRPSRPFSASKVNRLPVAALYLTFAATSFSAAAFTLRFVVGSRSRSRIFGSERIWFCSPFRSFSTASSAFVLEAAE